MHKLQAVKQWEEEGRKASLSKGAAGLESVCGQEQVALITCTLLGAPWTVA